MLSKYRACLVSAVVGDCLGAPYEQDYWDELPSPSLIESTFKDLMTRASTDVNRLAYTDDTAMMSAVCRSLCSQQCFCATDMAQHFVKEYMSDRERGYGGHVVHVFSALNKQQCQRPYAPAQLQFDGHGSYGNGGAMRVAPVALFCCHNVDALIQTARDQARITHAHCDGYNGAVLQCLAVRLALQHDPGGNAIYCAAFVANLQSQMSDIERNTAAPHTNSDSNSDSDSDQTDTLSTYTNALATLRQLMSRDLTQVSRDSVVDLLGHSISASGSVPTAIFCFLRQVALSQSGVCLCNTAILDTIGYAISLGGDTDTIAAMAAALAGAYWGECHLPQAIVTCCEGADEALNMADTIHSLVQPAAH